MQPTQVGLHNPPEQQQVAILAWIHYFDWEKCMGRLERPASARRGKFPRRTAEWESRQGHREATERARR